MQISIFLLLSVVQHNGYKFTCVYPVDNFKKSFFRHLTMGTLFATVFLRASGVVSQQ